MSVPAVVAYRPGARRRAAAPRRRRNAGSQSRSIAPASAAGSSASYSRPSSPSPTSWVIRSMAGATTGNPDAMYSNSFSGDQKKPSDKGGCRPTSNGATPTSAAARHAGIASCATGPTHVTPSIRSAAWRTAGSSGPSPIRTASTSSRPCSRSRRIASTSSCAPCQARNAPAKTTSVRRELRRVGSPLQPHNPIRRHPRRQDVHLRRDKQIGMPALPVAPPPHRLDEQRPVDPPLRGTWIVDHRRVHLEHRQRTHRLRRAHAFAAEVEIALDHHVRPDLFRQRADARRQSPAQPPRAERWTQVDPGGAVVRERTVTTGDDDMHVMTQGRQATRDGRHMDRSADAARHSLIGGDVENGHASRRSVTPAFRAARRSARSKVASGRSSRIATSR